MEILGVGPLELIFILIVALIVLGPQDMKKAGLTLGRFLRKVVTSQGWREFQQGWRNLRYLPNRLMREAGMEEDIKTLKESVNELQKIKVDLDLKDVDKAVKETESDISAWLKPPTIDSPPPPELAAAVAAAPAVAATPAPEIDTPSTLAATTPTPAVEAPAEHKGQKTAMSEAGGPPPKDAQKPAETEETWEIL